MNGIWSAARPLRVPPTSSSSGRCRRSRPGSSISWPIRPGRRSCSPKRGSARPGRLYRCMDTVRPQRRLVLVVDDEPMLRNLLSRLLRMEGYDVIEAEDGRVALNLVDTERPDLVLLDVMMPARNGLDVLGDLRATSDVPVILVSALAEEADRVVGLK